MFLEGNYQENASFQSITKNPQAKYGRKEDLKEEMLNSLCFDQI
jgi:hypothetical protein